MPISRSDAYAIARRYAAAIFALGVEAGNEMVIVEEIGDLARAIRSSRELRTALSSPIVSREEKANVLTALSSSARPLTQRAVAAIGRSDRGDLLPIVADMLRTKLAETRGELIAEITSARPIGEHVRHQLELALVRATGKKVQMEMKEQPSLLGGIKIQLGSLELDASLAGALTAMRADLIARANQSS